jgi:hypothetical protein
MISLRDFLAQYCGVGPKGPVSIPAPRSVDAGMVTHQPAAVPGAQQRAGSVVRHDVHRWMSHPVIPSDRGGHVQCPGSGAALTIQRAVIPVPIQRWNGTAWVVIFQPRS